MSIESWDKIVDSWTWWTRLLAQPYSTITASQPFPMPRLQEQESLQRPGAGVHGLLGIGTTPAVLFLHCIRPCSGASASVYAEFEKCSPSLSLRSLEPKWLLRCFYMKIVFAHKSFLAYFAAFQDWTSQSLKINIKWNYGVYKGWTMCSAPFVWKWSLKICRNCV